MYALAGYNTEVSCLFTVTFLLVIQCVVINMPLMHVEILDAA